MAVLGAQQSALEAVLLKRRVMGPSWLTLACPTRVNTGAQVTHLLTTHPSRTALGPWSFLAASLASARIWSPAKDGGPGSH